VRVVVVVVEGGPAPSAPTFMRWLVLHDARIPLANSIPKESVDTGTGGQVLDDVVLPVCPAPRRFQFSG
jgi:hypothetical protein